MSRRFTPNAGNIGMHAERQRETAREFARGELLPIRFAEREGEIAALPLVEWKGRRLRTIRCVGGHALNVPEALLWSLMSLDYFYCSFHSHCDAVWRDDANGTPPIREKQK